MATEEGRGINLGVLHPTVNPYNNITEGKKQNIKGIYKTKKKPLKIKIIIKLFQDLLLFFVDFDYLILLTIYIVNPILKVLIPCLPQLSPKLEQFLPLLLL
ncbi:MAG: hypothetical protein F6K63_02515 [Moorea sp. SIO1G6]|uniref:Uncharacterized protein n=1 Tax=Moorena producens (strain JHB) TaxID=1454205 RepID=A0A1D9G469_MOOP1|nr:MULTISPECIES: hypothetical protein [Moorena]AOY82383.1 hypothetical protein BJP36_23215 [Moorena producens JHB]NES80923.1 hypothetical protein [Moorena sp. SIO2B7]NET63333.1 hypothetical protein [Moorena sp. SIO1G6]